MQRQHNILKNFLSYSAKQFATVMTCREAFRDSYNFLEVVPNSYNCQEAVHDSYNCRERVRDSSLLKKNLF